jgi:hypothetical protein
MGVNPLTNTLYIADWSGGCVNVIPENSILVLPTITPTYTPGVPTITPSMSSTTF